MNNIIYMAAGNSSRFGSNKLLYELDGRPVYKYALSMLEEIAKERADCSLLVVTQYEEIYEYACAQGIPAVMNPDSRLGVSYTIKAGLNYYIELGGTGCSSLGSADKLDCQQSRMSDKDYYIFVVADQPYLTKESVEKLLKVLKTGVGAASMRYGNNVGNPVAFSAKYVPDLLKLEGDKGGRKVLKEDDCVYVEAGDEKELIDMDFPKDTITCIP